METPFFWIWGFMPVQFLLVLVGVFFLFTGGQFILRKTWRPVPAFGQAVLIPLTAYAILKWGVYRPIPSSLMITYMAAIGFATFIFISSTDRSWNSFKRTTFNILLGKNLGHRFVRALSVLAIPLIGGLLIFQVVKPPEIVAPLELRGYHPAPPASITVYPPEYFRQNPS